TGIIEEIGNVSEVNPIPGGKTIKISVVKILNDISVNDSVNVNGVCLTATEVDEQGFKVDAVGVTLEKSTFSDLQISSPVNLELSLKLSDRLGGHFVLGHVNGTGVIKEIIKLGDNYLMRVNVPDNMKKYLIEEGSITIDGISLTIAELKDSTIGISIIPHTWNNTTLQYKNAEDRVNIETDVLAKYVERRTNKKEFEHKNKLSENWLKELGY
ncbi:MAG: riboflavin synthase, partial [Bacteroidetes bacterium]|nr:riboflavin synthase [Bacteroidota bacterium]